MTDDYAANGCIACTRVLPLPQTINFRHDLENFIQNHSDDPRFCDWCYFKSHVTLPWVTALANAPGVVDVVTRILGPDILLWNSFIPIKAPHSQGHFAWHQDATYWYLTPVEEMTTVWVALGDVSPGNGSMQFLPASHIQGQMPHGVTKDAKSMLRRGQGVLDAVDDGNAVSCILTPGEASIHHPFTLHRSSSNGSGKWRLAVALNYVSADVNPKLGYKESALYIAGEDRNTSFERDPVPTEALSVDALSALDHAASLVAARYSDV